MAAIKKVATPATAMPLAEKLHNIQQGLVVQKGQYNDFGKYRFRSAEDILNALKPLLSKYKANVTLEDQVIVMDGHLMVKASVNIECIEEGTVRTMHAYAGIGPLKGMSIAQTYGASSSYARKYAMNGMFAIDEHTDADTQNDGEVISKMPTTAIEVEVSEKQPEPKGQTAKDKKKQDLVQPSKRWDNVVKRLENGSATIDTVINAFNILDADLKVLKSIKKK